MLRSSLPAGPSSPPPPLPLGWVTCQSPDGRAFYHNPHSGESSWAVPCASSPYAPFAPHPSAPPLTSSNASFDTVVVDPELQSLIAALTSLKIGNHTTCAALALALQHKGVVCVEDLRLLSEADARDLLERVGFEKIQQLKLMQAVAPPAAAAQGAAAADAARVAAGCCVPSLSLRMTPEGFTAAVPGVTHADVFALDERNAGIVRVRARGVYQLHAAVRSHAYVEAGGCFTFEVLVNGTVRCRSSIRMSGYAGVGFYGPLIVFDILQLDANDAITVKTEQRTDWDRDSRLNLVLLQRL
jgi:hypothetical protein